MQMRQVIINLYGHKSDLFTINSCRFFFMLLIAFFVCALLGNYASPSSSNSFIKKERDMDLKEDLLIADWLKSFQVRGKWDPSGIFSANVLSKNAKNKRKNAAMCMCARDS